MRKFLLLMLFVVTTVLAQGIQEFPEGPNGRITPGTLCDHPSEYRYPERIAYCRRDVDSHTKAEVFAIYRRLGYRLDPRTRSSYKIDHLIPLCAGGSNEIDNLWPQHISVGKYTDPLEGLGCEKMSQGRLTQKRFIELLMKAKNDVDLADEVYHEINRL